MAEPNFPAAESTPPRTRSLTDTFHNVKSFLKGRALPGGVRLSRDSSTVGAPPAATPRDATPPHLPNPSEGMAHVGGPAGAPSPSRVRSLEEKFQAAVPSAQHPGFPRTASGMATGSSGSAGDPLRRNPSSGTNPSQSSARVAKFNKLLSEPVVSLEALRELSWNGIPAELRPLCWRILLGYVPTAADRREGVVARKRREYADMVPRFYDIPNEERTDDELTTLRQIQVDTPRTAPGVAFVQHPSVATALERVLYIRAIRHPASSYVQGINDLVTPFLYVFLSEDLGPDHKEWDVGAVGGGRLMEVEADCYWCLCGLLEGIQDNYTYAQPGIQRTVWGIRELVTRIEEPVAAHLEAEGVEFLQFAFRWVNCLLVREVPFELGPRLWDTWLAEGTRFKDFVVYACASFLLTWSAELKTLEFQDMVMLLQSLPTQGWGEEEMAMVLSRAYMWKNMFQSARSHFSNG